MSKFLGPVLHLQGIKEGLRLSAIVVGSTHTLPPPLASEHGLSAFECIDTFGELAVYQTSFKAPDDRAWSYEFAGQRFACSSCWYEDLRMAYVSCNGEESEDLNRDGSERIRMWARLVKHHQQQPFSLLIHGGDQIYADEAAQGHALSDKWPKQIPEKSSPNNLQSLRSYLRRQFLARYLAHMRSPEYAWLAARIPSVAQWDDHDICDGWGSLCRSRTSSSVGQTLFAVARELALLFQHGIVENRFPDRFADPEGRHLGWMIDLPGLRLLAPDLRSERTRRRIMGEGGWALMDAASQKQTDRHTFLLSSVPLLGPRLSIVETIMMAIPRMQRYEDDLRDQWQSRAHRADS